MRIILASVFGASITLFAAGCTLHTGASVGVETPSVDVDAPVVEGPGVFTVDVDPPPDQRVYVYDEGFPPGVYLYGGYYYYGGHRYEKDVFINRVVKENVRNHRYINVEQNRAAGRQIEEKHKVEYQKSGGKHAPHNAAEGRAPEKRATEKPAPEKRAVEHPNNPAAHHEPVHEQPAKTPEHRLSTPEHHENVTEPHATPAHPKEEVRPPEKNIRPPEKPAQVPSKEDRKKEEKRNENK